MFHKNRSGHILAFTLAVMGILFVLVGVALSLLQAEYASARRSYANNQALHLAEAGVDHAIRQLNSNPTYTGETDTGLGSGTFSLSVTGTGSARTIQSTGYIPNSTNPIYQKTVTIEASLNSDSVEFFYGIQVDAGGLTLGNNSEVVGNVYSNGSIVGAGSISGDATVAGGLNETPSFEWTAHTDDQSFATMSSNRDIAQSFTATTSGSLNKVSVYLGKVGNPTSNLSVRVASDASNKPSTSSLSTSIIASSSVGLTASWIDVTFANPATLTSGQKYWIILDYGSDSTVNYWNWRKDPTDAYSGNTGRSTSNCCNGNPTWTDVGGDLAFRAWVGGTTTRIEGATIGSALTGTARANLFVNTNVRGNNCPNQYCIVENPSPEPLPLSDGVVEDWKNDALAGGVHSGNYTLINGAIGSIGPKKIDGNLLVDNGATLTITGTLWVTGTITLSNNAIVRLDPGYASNSGIIVGDNTIDIINNAVFEGADEDSYILLLTTRDAKNEVSINVSNNSEGVIYYAGKSRIAFANNATAKEATAWGIDLANNAVITYESGLANTTFTGGPGGGWAIKRGTWRLLN